VKICTVILSFAFLLGPNAGAWAGMPDISNLQRIDGRYGIRIRFDQGIVSYPDFTVRFASRTELARNDGAIPWVKYAFEVLDTDNRTIGGDITFNSEERANGRRFDVRGKIYFAEMFYSTAGLKNGEIPPLGAHLAPDEMVIWDRSSAARGNSIVARIWETETVDPSARYSQSNAYAGGVILPGFGSMPGRIDGKEHRLSDDGLKMFVVPLAVDENGQAITGAVKCSYGSRVFFARGSLTFPDFTVRLVSREERDLTDVRTASTSYMFSVLDRSGNRTGFRFDTVTMANGSSFAFGGTTYFAEMFFTTANPPGSTTGRVDFKIPMKTGELIVWNESLAKLDNPKILTAWDAPQTSSGGSRATRFASGTPLPISMFTGTYMIGNSKSYCEYKKLDYPPTVVRNVQIEYPPALSGSGFVGHVGGYLIVNEDGSIAEAITTYGDEPMFQKSSEAAVRQLRFTPPIKDSKATKALISYSCAIMEPMTDTTALVFK
jgi:hypothetical protein